MAKREDSIPSGKKEAESRGKKTNSEMEIEVIFENQGQKLLSSYLASCRCR